MADNKKIFVSIASYRDPEVVNTIKDLYEKAKNPNDIYVGLVTQDDGSISFDKNPNVKIIQYDWRESQGACWARSIVQENLYNDEQYYFQLDSHHRFCENWDELLIESLEILKTTNKKPIIGGYCPGYNPLNNELEGNPCKMNAFPDFSHDGDLHFLPKTIKNYEALSKKNIDHISARFLSGHFIFADASFIKECPYDPNLYFRGEELSLSARAFTSGYDFFHPTKRIVWHYYLRENYNKHWVDHVNDNGFLISGNQRADKAKARTRALLNMEPTKILFHRFGLGKERSLHEYELYAGLDFKSRKVHKYAYDIKDIHKPPFIMSEFEWSNGLMNKYRIEFNIEEKILNDIKDASTKIINIIPENKVGLPVYRKDIKKPNLPFLKNKIELYSSMDEKPSRITIVRHYEENKISKILTTTDFRIL